MNKETTDQELEQMLDRDRLAVFISHVSSEDVQRRGVSGISGVGLTGLSPHR